MKPGGKNEMSSMSGLCSRGGLDEVYARELFRKL